MPKIAHGFAQVKFAFWIQAAGVERIIPFNEADRKL